MSRAPEGADLEPVPDGIALGLSAGIEWWVASEWSIGFEGSFSQAYLSADADGIEIDDRWLAIGVAAVFTYH